MQTHNTHKHSILKKTNTARARFDGDDFHLLCGWRTTHMSLRHLFVGLIVAFASADDDVIRLPVEVDQQGKKVYFVVRKDSDVMLEALRFCKAPLPSLDKNECMSNLIQQVATIRNLRQEAAASIPGMKFTVNDADGNEQTFVHEEGADPREESREFCTTHYPQANEDECIEAMLSNAARALDDINAKYDHGNEL